MLKSVMLTLATVMAANAIAAAALAGDTVKPQKPIEMPPLVVKGDRPSK